MFQGSWLILGSLAIMAFEIVPVQSFAMETAVLMKAIEVGTKLKDEAEKKLAPFTETSLTRLHTTLFGKGRASRSTDVVIFNKTDKTFILKRNGCEWGGWSPNMFPEHVIPAHNSVLYGAESQGFMAGLAECVVVYQSNSGSPASFELTTSNPYWSPNIAIGVGRGVDVLAILGKGTNNQVQFIISN